MNFPSQIFFNDINYGLQSSYIKEKFFVAASILYGVLLVSIMKICAERCALQLHQISLR